MKDGVINIYKNVGISSFAAVREVKKLCHTPKVGHTGTLDPEASGVLPICVGKATKIVENIMNGRKKYKAMLKLGVITSTYDKEGEIVEVKDVNLKEEDIINAILSFVGEINQIPPMYSALKVNGKRLYELARQGIEIERKERKITIYDIQIESIAIPYVTFYVECSKGTYIRSLCYDIGEKLKCGGAMWELERVQSSSFYKENSIPLEDLTEDNITNYIIPIKEVLDFLPKLYVNKKFSKLLINGINVQDNTFLNLCNEKNKEYLVLEEDTGSLIGIGERNDIGFKMKKLLLEE